MFRRLFVSLLLLLAPAVAAQALPDRPIRVVVPWPAGGTTDGVARVMQARLAERLSRPVVIENKPGAGSSVGTRLVAQLPADGTTLLVVYDTHAVNHHLYKSLNLDPFRTFVHISQLVSLPLALVAANRFAPSSLDEIVDFARMRPDAVNYGSVGTGSSNHLLMVALMARTGTRMVHVPHKGSAPLMQDIVTGQLDITLVSAPPALPHVKAGRMKAIAVGGAKRLPQLPGTPTLAETLPGFEAITWVGIAAHAATPGAVVDQLHRELVGALGDKGVGDRLVEQGFDIVGSTPQQFTAFLRAESERLGRIVVDNGIMVE